MWAQIVQDGNSGQVQTTEEVLLSQFRLSLCLSVRHTSVP